MRNYEDQAQRRARKVADIKAKFATLWAEENKKPKEEQVGVMEIYKAVAYDFYLSPTEIREIIAGRR